MFLEQSKTDMYPKRIWMHLTINFNLGPIIVVSKYLNIGTTAETFQRYILRDVIKTKTCSRLWKNSKQISHTCVREKYWKDLRR